MYHNDAHDLTPPPLNTHTNTQILRVFSSLKNIEYFKRPLTAETADYIFEEPSNLHWFVFLVSFFFCSFIHSSRK